MWVDIELLRLNKPRGIVLLAWPTLMPFALHLEHGDLRVLSVFLMGIVVMRSLGCLVNDWWDQDYDRHVERTQLRPLAAGRMSQHRAYGLALSLGMIALCLWTQLNPPAQLIAILAGLMTLTYPLMKRCIQLPQVFLGLTFSMGIWMAFYELGCSLNFGAVLCYGLWVYWIFVYDTLYARADMKDDLKIDVRSSAIYLGNGILDAVFWMYGVLVLWMVLVGFVYDLGHVYFLTCYLCALVLYIGYLRLDLEDEQSWMKGFLSHQWVGAVYTLGIILDQLF